MRNFNIPLYCILIALMSAGCSIQKRSLLPGYHIEWRSGIATASSLDQTEIQNPSIETDFHEACAAEASLSGDRLLASEVQPNFPKVIPTIRHIPPHAIDHEWNAGQLIEPTPWAEAEKKQRLFGNIAKGLALAALVAPTFLPVAGSVMLVAFILNRHYRRQVLDIKAANGIDVTQERERIFWYISNPTDRIFRKFLAALLLFGLALIIVLLAVLLGGGFCFFC